MKKIIFILMVLTLVSVAHATPAGISVNITKYEPYPAEPGKYVDVWLKVRNVGTEDADNVEVNITPKFPFSLDPSEDSYINLGTIVGGREEILRVRIKVDENAVEGDNFLDISYRYSGFDWLTKRFKIFVQTHDAILSIEKVYTKPDLVSPGETANLTFVFKNLADTFLSNIDVKLDLTNVPFAPINSTTEKRMNLIESGDIGKISFMLAPLSDTKSGIYKIPVTISYSDNTGTKYTKEDLISIIVGDKPDVDIYLDESDILKAGESGTVKLTIVNEGLSDIKFLSVELLNSEDYEKLSSDKVYIGDLDSDDTDTVEFSVYVNPTSDKQIPLQTKVSYLDSNNIHHEETKNVNLRLYTSSEISRYGLRESSNLSWIIAAVVLLAIGYIGYTKLMKRND
ncbi:MAG: COG1361 S-layer family protein [Nanoarchaeota archaeon]|nr:COG1361 S-layer family protein [Nanoarchaeota archaeon]